MYFIPLLVILVAYIAILCEISNKSRETNDKNPKPNGRLHLRRSDISNIERARSRTLKMTITIVLVFVWCWTPYAVMTLWYMFDRESAERLPNWLQDGLFMMAVSNSCMNPVVYGSYAINFRKECGKCFCCARTSVEPPVIARKSTDACKVRTTAGQPRLARRLIKCVLSLRKGATRSTGTVHGVATNRSPAPAVKCITTNEKTTTVKLERKRQHSFDLITTCTESNSRRNYQSSFHSDPFPLSEENYCELSNAYEKRKDIMPQFLDSKI